jgi:D-alanyl-lipoteichoic acid acyltransferase DltB (MBOAT superfamily)
MLFNSYEFIFLFLPVSLSVYFLLNRMKLTIGASAWLLFVSLFFYSWWNVKYLPLILGSILFNYTIGGLLADSDSNRKQTIPRRMIFLFGVTANILFLSYFKYMDFFIANINTLAGTTLPLLKIILPLGISFFTITQIAFLVDAYEGVVIEKNLLNYALFVTFFPHLLAGPILHHKDMMPQFANVRNKVLNYRNLTMGLFLFFIGLFKKVILADDLSATSKLGFQMAQSLNFFEAWVTSLSYTFQLYFDFSGYTDMALGVGLMFNIVLPRNFNSPYKATSIIDFWRRWHMTLSTFVTTYIYTPILRSFETFSYRKSLFAIFVAMLICGFWHGAGWTFIFWGALQGAALVVNHLWRKRKFTMPRWFGWFLTFNFFNISLVFFRAKDWNNAVYLLKGMVGLNGFLPATMLDTVRARGVFTSKFGDTLLSDVGGSNRTLLGLIIAMIFVLALKNSNELKDGFQPTWKTCAFMVGISFYAFLNMGKVTEFLYFQF